jgi:signal transduction histidine kinase
MADSRSIWASPVNKGYFALLLLSLALIPPLIMQFSTLRRERSRIHIILTFGGELNSAKDVTSMPGTGDRPFLTHCVPPCQRGKKAIVQDKIIELGLSLSTTLELDKLLDTIVHEAAAIFEAEGASIILLDEQKESLHFGYFVSSGERDKLKQLVLKQGEGIAGHVTQTGKALIIEDVQKDTRFSSKADDLTGNVTRTMMAVPLNVKNKILGAMEVINKVQGIFTKHELAACQTLASFASVAIENARLHGEVKESLNKITRLEASKHELITLLSHELRTPVTIILTSSTLLSNHLNQMEKEMISETAEMITNRSLRLGSLIDDLFVINDIDDIRNRLVVEDIPIREVIELSIVRFRRYLKKHRIEVTFPRRGALPPLRADRLKLQHCIFHLIENAIKFSPQGGTINIKVYYDDDSPFLFHLEIEDPGIGISTNNIDKIFDKFYQVDSSSTRRFGGLGLGLFICRRVAEIHGGEMKCISKLGKGSRFILSLPAAFTGK